MSRPKPKTQEKPAAKPLPTPDRKAPAARLQPAEEEPPALPEAPKSKPVLDNDAAKSIVRIRNRMAHFDLDEPFREPSIDSEQHGTGYYISPHVLVTNYHVVRNNAVLFTEGDDGEKLQAHAVCLNPKIDLSFVYSPKAGVPLKISASDNIQKGDKLVGRGYPLDMEQLHSNTGTVSNFDGAFLIVDTPQNPGNSGGPLTDEKGVVVATCNAGRVHANAMSYGIPSFFVRQMVGEFIGKVTGTRVSLESNWEKFDPKALDRAAESVLKQKGKVKPVILYRPRKDFEVQRGNRFLLDSRMVDRQKHPSGVLVTEVLPGGPSEKAGLRPGDLILEIDGYPVDFKGRLRNYKLYSGHDIDLSTLYFFKRAGEKVAMKVISKDTKRAKDLQVPAGSSNDFAVRSMYFEVDQPRYTVFAGLVFMELLIDHYNMGYAPTPELQLAFQNKERNSPKVIVANVFTDSFLSCKHTIAPGDLLQNINGIPIKNIADVEPALLKVAKDTSQPYYIFGIGVGREAHVHKITAVREEPTLQKINHYKESPVVKVLAQNIKADWREPEDECIMRE